MNKPELEHIAALRFEIPLNDSGTSVGSQSRGTLEITEVESGVSAMDEVIHLSDRETFRVGRAKTNDLVLRNSSVSRHHVVFSASRSGLVLSDLSSLNGTFVNGRKVSHPVSLSTGDKVKIGRTRITVELLLGSSSDEDFSALQTQSTAMRSVMVTVLIADIKGYTQMSQVIPGAQMVPMLDSWFRKVSDVIGGYGGEVDKYIGDCVMAFWKSADEKVGESAVSAVQAAREIIVETEAMNEAAEWTHSDSHPWQCRVVLNTGDALIGNVGATEARDFTVLGNTVNVAFRLEGVDRLKEHDLVFSATTAIGIQEQFPVRSIGSVTIDGQTESLEVFTLD